MLCVYLDPGREWHPGHGITGFLNRLYDWFFDAAAARFDARTALYHAVGGVLHEDDGTPLIVVRHLPDLQQHPFVRLGLSPRGEHRLDVVAEEDGSLPLLVVSPNGPLRFGAGSTFGELLDGIAGTGYPKPPNVVAALARHARSVDPGEPLDFMLAVPAPPLPGTDEPRRHLVAGRLPSEATAHLSATIRGAGPLYEPSPNDLPAGTIVEWCAVSDERPEVTLRRDDARPAGAFVDATVEVWGCGALGSWIAEFVVRAGARRVIIRDPGRVTGGLLVRQNFTEDDVGDSKAVALRKRLRALSDGVVVEPHPDNALASVASGKLPACDLIIDATVTTAVAVLLDTAWAASSERPVVAKVATDTPSATLALLAVCHANSPLPPMAIDDLARNAVASDPHLERFAVFWQDVEAQELVPAPGCSVPTFHGAAADVAAVAGVIVSLLGSHLRTAASGTHLAALPTAPSEGEPHRWLPVS